MPDWTRIFPDADHRWIMGLARESRCRITSRTGTRPAPSAPNVVDGWRKIPKYAALLPEAEPALRETVQLARDLGAWQSGEQRSPREQLLDLGWPGPGSRISSGCTPGADGLYRLIGGVLCFPSSWVLRDKLGRPISEVHGPVPGPQRLPSAGPSTRFSPNKFPAWRGDARIGASAVT